MARRIEEPEPHEPHEPRRPYEGPQGLEAVPGMVRIAIGAWWRSTGWAVRSSPKVPRLMVEMTLQPHRALELARELRERLPDLVGQVDAQPAAPADNGRLPEQEGREVARGLREEGEELLRRSRDVRYDVRAHPAYERILHELAPDEARILRLLLLEGPQPSVDVRTGGPLGLLRSELIAPGLSMIGARAGCRYTARVPSYLNNLFRLGLVWFSRETLRDPLKYQVLEAQPDVLHAIHSVRYAKVVRRSIHLTPFGEDFCSVCLMPEDREPQDLPQHSTPPSATSTPGPPSDLAAEL